MAQERAGARRSAQERAGARRSAQERAGARNSGEQLRGVRRAQRRLNGGGGGGAHHTTSAVKRRGASLPDADGTQICADASSNSSFHRSASAGVTAGRRRSITRKRAVAPPSPRGDVRIMPSASASAATMKLPAPRATAVAAVAPTPFADAADAEATEGMRRLDDGRVNLGSSESRRRDAWPTDARPPPRLEVPPPPT